MNPQRKPPDASPAPTQPNGSRRCHWLYEAGWVLLDQPLQRLVWDQPLQTNLYSMPYYICSFSPPMVGPRTDLQPLHPIICVDFPRPWLVLGPTFNLCTITTSQPASQAARSYRNSCMTPPQGLVLRQRLVPRTNLWRQDQPLGIHATQRTRTLTHTYTHTRTHTRTRTHTHITRSGEGCSTNPRGCFTLLGFPNV